MTPDAPATPRKNRLPEIWLTILGTLAFIFIYPRLLIRWFEADSPWLPYFYLYGLGFVVFAIGIQIILKSRACQPGRGHDSFWFNVLFFGFIFFVLLHAFWIWAALTLPFKGGI